MKSNPIYAMAVLFIFIFLIVFLVICNKNCSDMCCKNKYPPIMPLKPVKTKENYVYFY